MVRMFVFGVVVRDMLGMTESSSVFGAFMRCVRFKFGAIRGAVFFNFLGIFLRQFGFRGSLIFGSIEVRFLLAFFFFGFFVLREFGFASGVNLLRFIVFEFSATNEGIGFGVIGSFLVLCLG